MALYFLYRPESETAIGIYETREEAEANSNSLTTVVEGDFEIGDVDVLGVKLSNDGQSMVERFPGATVEEQKSQYNAAGEETVKSELRSVKKQTIKSTAKGRIEELAWKYTRAADEDLINGNTAATDAVNAERQAIRDANNAYEATLDALTDLQAIKDFDPTDF